MIKILNIVRNGDILTIELEGILIPMVCCLTHIPDKEALIAHIKEFIEYQSKDKITEDVTNAKYDKWVRNMVGEEIA